MTEELGDELLVYCTSTQTAHALSDDAASVWRLCDGHTSATGLAGRLGLDETRVDQALEQLSAAQLIDEPDGLSRREASKRMVKLGAAALTAPLIYSVAIPANAAATLCTANCPSGSVIPCGEDTCAAIASSAAPAETTCSSHICYRGATNNTCYCAPAALCGFAGASCGGPDERCCAGDQFCVAGFCQQ